MNIDLGVMAAQLVNFGILFFLFNKFLSTPISQEIQARKELLEKTSNLDKEVEIKMLEANKMAEEIKDEALKTAQETIDSSIILAKKKADTILSKADEEAKNKLADSLREIEKERLSMMDGVKSKITSLVLKLNGKLFKDSSANEEFLNKEMESVKL